MKNTVKWFRKIRTQNKILGLEFFDLLLLLGVFLLVFMVSKNLVANLLVVSGAYGILGFYKKGKPAHWTGSVAAFLLRARTYPTLREWDEEIFA